MTRTETTLKAMHETIGRYDLLEHPFYQAWSAGTLPVDALATYAREYGAFIGVLDRGWATLGEPEAAAVERHHVALWNDFARALGTCVVDAPALGALQALVDEAKLSFATAAGAVGALYAFEAQQPSTARSKLQGLASHYAALPAEIRPYFEAHAGETGEGALLAEKLESMTEVEKTQALSACERMSKALWDALTGIHAGTC